MSDPLPNEALRLSLQALVQRIVTEVRAGKSAGWLVLRREKYTLRPDFSLLCSADPTIRDFPLEEGEEDIWDSTEMQSFLREQVEATIEYREALQAVGVDAEPNRMLGAFVWRVGYDAALAVETRIVEQHVETLLQDLGGEPPEYKARVWLTGVTLTEESLRISDVLTLRRPTKSDMQEKVSERMLHYAHAFHGGGVHFSCIAELLVRARQPFGVQKEVDRLVSALRLFKLGSVSAARYDLHSESFVPFASLRTGSQSRAIRIEYALSLADAPILDHFLSTLAPLLPSIYTLPPQKSDFLSTAFQWYSEALLAMGPSEGMVAWAIACLEALFLGDNPPSELSYRLMQRTASLLKCFGWESLQIRKTLKTAYDVRSKYVHGATPKKLSHEELSRLYRETAEYARVGCLIWVQLTAQGQHKRENILRALDEAMVDDSARDLLERWCDRVEFARRPV